MPLLKGILKLSFSGFLDRFRSSFPGPLILRYTFDIPYIFPELAVLKNL